MKAFLMILLAAMVGEPVLAQTLEETPVLEVHAFAPISETLWGDEAEKVEFLGGGVTHKYSPTQTRLACVGKDSDGNCVMAQFVYQGRNVYSHEMFVGQRSGPFVFTNVKNLSKEFKEKTKKDKLRYDEIFPITVFVVDGLSHLVGYYALLAMPITYVMDFAILPINGPIRLIEKALGLRFKKEFQAMITPGEIKKVNENKHARLNQFLQAAFPWPKELRSRTNDLVPVTPLP